MTTNNPGAALSEHMNHAHAASLSADLWKHVLSFLGDLRTIRRTVLGMTPVLDDVCVRPYHKKLHRGLNLGAHGSREASSCEDCVMAEKGRIRCCYCELQFPRMTTNACRRCGFLLCDTCQTTVSQDLEFCRICQNNFCIHCGSTKNCIGCNRGVCSRCSFTCCGNTSCQECLVTDHQGLQRVWEHLTEGEGQGGYLFQCFEESCPKGTIACSRCCPEGPTQCDICDGLYCRFCRSGNICGDDYLLMCVKIVQADELGNPKTGDAHGIKVQNTKYPGFIEWTDPNQEESKYQEYV